MICYLALSLTCSSLIAFDTSALHGCYFTAADRVMPVPGPTGIKPGI